MDDLLDLVYQPYDSPTWPRAAQAALASLWSPNGRYRDASGIFAIRAPEGFSDSDAPFAALIDPSNASSGPYGGMSLVIFPGKDAPALIAMVIGTQGLAPDEDILSRPGHARHLAAITYWLNATHGHGKLSAWAKADPVRTDIPLPDTLTQQLSAYRSACRKYGNEIYAFYVPDADRAATADALAAFVDLAFSERNVPVRAASRSHVDQIRSSYERYLMPDLSAGEVVSLLASRRFVVIEGPPGTGKTKMALDILANEYDGRGRSIQFHPSTTYENFVGGLAPLNTDGSLGLQFAPKRGALMEAALHASRDDRPYLLHIDEVNRADLSKVLGEAIFLFEANESDRRIELAYDFGEPFGRQLGLPSNLHVLGTMNSADRSIAILDVAIRRRFAFVQLWPQAEVVRRLGSPLMQEAFRRLVDIFTEHARGDAMALVPGHSYFLETDDRKALALVKVSLVPLLREYVSQAYAAGFAEDLLAYMQWLEGMGA